MSRSNFLSAFIWVAFVIIVVGGCFFIYSFEKGYLLTKEARSFLTQEEQMPKESFSLGQQNFLKTAKEDAFSAAKATGQTNEEAEEFARKAEEAAKSVFERKDNVLDF